MDRQIEIFNFCENIKRLRKRNKFSQKEMARRLQIGVWSLAKLEKGVLPPRLRLSVLFYISKEFGLYASDLFARVLEA